MGDNLNVRGLSAFAYAYGLARSRTDAQRLFNELELLAASGSYVSPTDWALGHLAIGQDQEALDWLQTIAANKEENRPSPELTFLRVNAFSDPILDQPGFVAVRERLGFTDL